MTNYAVQSPVSQRPKLTVPQQISCMKDNGIRFEIFPEEQAAEFLTHRNFFFKVKAFAKNFDKWRLEDGSLGRYMNLDFAYLVELSKLDAYLRSFVLGASLDIEHFLKVRINEAIMTDSMCDGYQVVSDFLNYDDARKAQLVAAKLEDAHMKAAAEEITRLASDALGCMKEGTADARFRAAGCLDDLRKVVDAQTGRIDLRHVEKSISLLSMSSYSRSMADKYGKPGNMAVWNFMELVSFGDLISFYKYYFVECVPQKNDTAQKIKPLLFPAKTLRNAAAHNSCLLHGMRERLSKPVGAVAKALRDNYGYDAEQVGATRRVPVVHDLSALLVCYDHVVEGPGVRSRRAKEMRTLQKRFMENAHYFTKQPEVTAVVGFIAALLEGFGDVCEKD